MERETFVFNIQHYSLHDGPGIRTIVFLKGCPLRCRWCCNPESQSYTPEVSYVQKKCIGEEACGFCRNACPDEAVFFDGNGHAVIDRFKCGNCLKCTSVCPSRAMKREGKQYSVPELLDMVERDAMFYSRSGGGLTVSGGEPLSHGSFLIRLLKEAKKRRIHTAMETCGFAEPETLLEAAEYLDTVLFDIKSMDDEKHRAYTGQGNGRILTNFQKLCESYPKLPKKVRTPVIPGFNDTPEDLEKILSFLRDKPNVSYEPLPYHSFGRGKYHALGRPYEMGARKLSDEMRELIEKIKKSYNSY